MVEANRRYVGEEGTDGMSFWVVLFFTLPH